MFSWAVTKCFFSSWLQVVEFVQFKQRMEQSNQYLVAKIESAILKLKQNSNSAQEAEVLFSISPISVLAIGAFLISY